MFVFLSEVAACRPQGYDKEPNTTHGSDVLRSTTGLDVSNIALCSHEKAGTRLILNSADAVLKGHRRVSIRTVDTDLLVLAVASFDKIKPDELWVILSTGSHLRSIAIHELMAKMILGAATVFPSSMPSQDVTRCPSLVEERRRYGQHGGHF